MWKCGLKRIKPWVEKLRSACYPKNAKKSADGHAHNCLEEEFHALAPCVTPETSLSCTTFNILAPIYKRIGGESCRRESYFHDAWLSRNQRILDMLLLVKSSIICLQEFWLENEELAHLYEDNLGCAGYTTYKLARTNNRGDGLLTAIKKDQLRVLNYRELFFNDCGDRVAQIFHLCLKAPFYKRGHLEQDALLVNTHLLFPHDSTFCHIRLRQVHMIIEFLDKYETENGLSSVPIILCGDWNGSKRGHVYKFLRSQGFVSSYDAVHSYNDNDSHRWISHRNHRGNLCGVDFIWLRNPSVQKGFPPASWTEALLGLIQGITPRELGSANVLKSGDGPMNYTGFCINDAFLFPPEVEQGFWPEDYSLSDHAPLTAVFEQSKACDQR